MSPAAHLDIDSILDDLVHQFADPLAFYRELVQNSLDAGTGEIEVELRYEDDERRAVIDVRDWGHGMSRQIIENEFLRLFSSGKDRDLTKVGRFGIGFVSVFAIEPESVVVDTGRSGEYWRVVFSSDRRWELYEREYPFEGTRVRLYKPMQRDEYRELREDSKIALAQWCKHPAVPVRFEGEDVREEFDVTSAVKTAHTEEGTRVVIGLVDDDDALAGYYNRGLTLKERPQKPWPWVTYKIDSRYLEHTLTRDQLLEDEHFQKAQELLRELAEERLPEQLFDELERTASEEEADLDHHQTCCGLLAHYLSCGNDLGWSRSRRPIFRAVDGEPMSVRDVRRAAGRQSLELTRIAQLPADAVDDSHRVVFARDGGRQLLEQVLDLDAVSRLMTPRAYVEARVLIPKLCRDVDCRHTQRVKHAVRQMLDAGGWLPDQLVFVPRQTLPVRVRDRLAVCVPSERGPVDRENWRTPPLTFPLERFYGTTLIFNADHEMIEELIPLAKEEPEWVGMAAIESLFAETNDQLVTLAAQRRMERLADGGEIDQAANDYQR